MVEVLWGTYWGAKLVLNLAYSQSVSWLHQTPARDHLAGGRNVIDQQTELQSDHLKQRQSLINDRMRDKIRHRVKNHECQK
jgi:hypothetical protein